MGDEFALADGFAGPLDQHSQDVEGAATDADRLALAQQHLALRHQPKRPERVGSVSAVFRQILGHFASCSATLARVALRFNRT